MLADVDQVELSILYHIKAVKSILSMPGMIQNNHDNQVHFRDTKVIRAMSILQRLLHHFI